MNTNWYIYIYIYIDYLYQLTEGKRNRGRRNKTCMEYLTEDNDVTEIKTTITNTVEWT